MMGMEIDYSAVGEPLMSNEGMVLTFFGQVSPLNLTDPKPIIPSIPSAIDMAEGEIQIFLSDYILNSTIYSAFMTNQTSQTIKGIDVSLLLYIFPGFKKYDGDTVDIDVRIIGQELGYGLPTLEIINGDTIVTAMSRVTISVNDKEAGNVVLVILDALITGTMDFAITTGCILDPDLITLKLHVSEIITDKTKSLDKDDLNSIIGTATGVIKHEVNRWIKNQTLPNYFEYNGLSIDFTDTTLKEEHHYLVMQTTPKFSFVKKLESGY
jgi:hypothetical protein